MTGEITIRLDKKSAQKLLQALQNRTYDGLTKARADALSDFICELETEIEMSKITVKNPVWPY